MKSFTISLRENVYNVLFFILLNAVFDQSKNVHICILLSILTQRHTIKKPRFLRITADFFVGGIVAVHTLFTFAMFYPFGYTYLRYKKQKSVPGIYITKYQCLSIYKKSFKFFFKFLFKRLFHY